MNTYEKLKHYNQEHLLKFENELTDSQKQQLHNQINELDFSYLNELNKKEVSTEKIITPIKAITLPEIEAQKEEFFNLGLTALKNQEVGAMLLAGGMGTRLGSNNPKGMYNIGKTKDVYIFQRLIENLLDVVNLCGKFVPLFIMTSEHNHTTTTNFFEKHKHVDFLFLVFEHFLNISATCHFL